MRLSVDPSRDPADYPFSHRLRVRFAETDAMGIVHHSRYLPYLEEARVAYLRDLGHPYTEWRADGLEAAVLECWLQYRQPLRFDDVVTVHATLAAVTRTTFQMAYLLTAATGELLDADPTTPFDVRAVGVTVHGATSDNRPARLPRWLVDLGRGS